jgi:hypothetical protein
MVSWHAAQPALKTSTCRFAMTFFFSQVVMQAGHAGAPQKVTGVRHTADLGGASVGHAAGATQKVDGLRHGLSMTRVKGSQGLP